MRQAFAQTLMELAAADARVVLLTADLGFGVLEKFAAAYPDRFFNVGVAEANMVGLATGLAEAGYIPFIYSIATFATLRPYDQFRNGPVAHQLPVRLVGIGGGFEYGHNGLTHMALEDLGLMRMQPGLTTIVPADPAQAGAALRATYALPGPIYYRIGKNDALHLPELEGRFRLGRVEMVGGEGEVLLLATGAIAVEAAAAACLLRQSGIRAGVAVVSTLRPEPSEDLQDLLSRCTLAVTVEAHYLSGGLGSLVAEVIAGRGLGCRLLRCGVESMPGGRSGSEAYMNHLHGLSRVALARQILAALAP
ncbi:MAG: 1-deoxy-D-xylulose-5-phosphate synthase [Candidatus Latescibacteria bacterium]|nr:1-deoxy-D-xylulose-5-phosphate synthase [Candidatus Latescibacterota bacterium]